MIPFSFEIKDSIKGYARPWFWSKTTTRILAIMFIQVIQFI